MIPQYSPQEERVFNNYVRKFRNRYRIFVGDDGIWQIKCKRGDIEPYSLTELCCYKEFGSYRGVKALKRRLPDYCVTTQESDNALVFKFPAVHIHEIADLVSAYKRRQVTEAERIRLSNLSLAYGFKKSHHTEHVQEVQRTISQPEGTQIPPDGSSAVLHPVSHSNSRLPTDVIQDAICDELRAASNGFAV